jgi:sugar lactone lactonase YvrE
MAAVLGWIATGCSPGSPPGSVRLDSPFFSEARTLGTRGTALGQFNKPRSLTVDRSDNLYVTDMTGRVQKFSPTGAFLLSWQMPETDLGRPKGMACDSAGNIVVIEPHYSRINHFTPEGTLVAQWGLPGTNTGEFTVPRAVTVTANGDVLVCEYSRVDRVQSFRPSDKAFQFAFGHPGRGNGEFNRPEGLATDAQGRIYVADSCNHRIQVFSPTGHWLASYGGPGTGPGRMSYPYDIVVDGEGVQYVCEFGNSRIQIFNAKHESVGIIGGFGADPGRFHNPWSLALDSNGNLYVADGANHRVQILLRRARSRSAATGKPPGVGFPASAGRVMFFPRAGQFQRGGFLFHTLQGAIPMPAEAGTPDFKSS